MVQMTQLPHPRHWSWYKWHNCHMTPFHHPRHWSWYTKHNCPFPETCYGTNDLAPSPAPDTGHGPHNTISASKTLVMVHMTPLPHLRFASTEAAWTNQPIPEMAMVWMTQLPHDTISITIAASQILVMVNMALLPNPRHRSWSTWQIAPSRTLLMVQMTQLLHATISPP